MPKITIIGAGSTVFAAEVMRDLLAIPGIQKGEFALIDIDPQRLELSHRLADLLIQRAGKNWSVQASTDRTTLLPGSDYVINLIEVSGLQNVWRDYEIPLRYGVDQCIGDTIGPGGLFKALRTLPAWLEILADIQKLAPNALVMNYSNPMSILVLAAVRTCRLPVIGLCHSVQNTSFQLAFYLSVPYPELSWKCAGINHMAWFTELAQAGQDLYPLLHEKANLPEIYEQDPVRFELMRQFGAFVTESSGHVSEYLPYFRKRADLMQQFMRGGYGGESGFYARSWLGWREEAEQTVKEYLGGERSLYIHRGVEYASYIVEAKETGNTTLVYGNVPNTGLIPNLPQDGIVEVACQIDGSGIHPQYFGNLPSQLAALNISHMSFHKLVVEAVIEKNREAAIHSLMIDPLTSAVCSLSEIRQMFDEMARAQREYIPEFLQPS